MAAHAGEARSQLIEVARGCFGEPKPIPVQPPGKVIADETLDALEYRYVLSIEDGQARVRDLTVTSSTLADKALEDCMVAALKAASWPAEGRVRVPISDKLRLGDLLPATP